MNLFQCFVTPMKLNFNVWHRCETKMVQFRLNNSPSKYSSTSPCLVSSERVISTLATDILFGNDFRWRFMLTSVSNRPVLARQQSGQHSHRWLVECPKQLTPVTWRRLVYVFAASIFSSNLLFNCFVRDFIQDNGVCNVLNETDHSEPSQGKTWRCGDQLCRFLDHNFGEYWLSSFKAVFLAIDVLVLSLPYSKFHISGNNVNVDCIEVSSFCSGCALFEYVIKREYVFTEKRLILVWRVDCRWAIIYLPG